MEAGVDSAEIIAASDSVEISPDSEISKGVRPGFPNGCETPGELPIEKRNLLSELDNFERLVLRSTESELSVFLALSFICLSISLIGPQSILLPVSSLVFRAMLTDEGFPNSCLCFFVASESDNRRLGSTGAEPAPKVVRSRTGSGGAARELRDPGSEEGPETLVFASKLLSSLVLRVHVNFSGLSKVRLSTQNEKYKICESSLRREIS